MSQHIINEARDWMRVFSRLSTAVGACTDDAVMDLLCEARDIAWAHVPTPEQYTAAAAEPDADDIGLEAIDLSEYDALMQRLDAGRTSDPWPLPTPEAKPHLSPARPGRWPGGSSDRLIREDV